MHVWMIDTMELDGSGIDAHTINILVKAYKGKRCTMGVRTVDRALAIIQRYSVMVGEVLVTAAPGACASPRDARRLATALNISKGVV